MKNADSHIQNLLNQHGVPSERSSAKLKDYLTEEVRDFIQQSPFAVMATSASNGTCDATPRGGEPGFVKIIDDRTLLLPDIKGNRLFQSFQNILENPHASLIFFIPGNERTVRVNGKAFILTEVEISAIIEDAEVQWWDENTKVIQGLRIVVEEAYAHCPRALKFGALWKKH